jgi:hypothetical protein
MTSRTDQHDIDKLNRWYQELTSSSPSEFPAYAVFLVTGDDRVAHDIFRKFRASFETRNAGFENLVIFGQHGISSIARSLLGEFGLSEEVLPTLALVPMLDTTSVYSLPLPTGDSPTVDTEQRGELWQTILAVVETAADKRGDLAKLASIEGLACHQIAEGPLAALVGKLSQQFKLGPRHSAQGSDNSP